MPDAESIAFQELTGGDPLLSLRTRVLGAALAILALGVPAVGAIIVVASIRAGTLNGIAIVLALYTLVFPLLWLFRRRLGFNRSAIVLLAALALTAFFVEARGGVAAGNVLLNALVLTLAAVLFGRQGAIISLFGVVALFLVAALLVVAQVVPPIERTMWDPGRPDFWFRESVAFALFATALVVVPLYVIERLTAEANRLKRLAENEREQLVALARAEREREQERERGLEALKALEESRKIEALARLAGGMAHDFNNALTVIMGAAAEITTAAPAAACEANARAILDAAERAGDLTRELLTLGQGQVSESRPVSLAAFLRRLAPALRRIVPTDIALDVAIPAEHETVEVDPTGLERALLNLVINARDAMPSGGTLRIACSLLPGAHPGQAAQVALTVADTGVGMPADVLEHIFEPFFTTKTPGIGTGLGLATVRAFARESQGDVLVTSEQGHGTIFTLLLPAVDEPPATEDNRAVSPGASASVRTRKHVLLVEDHAAVRSSMARTLARAGFDVTEAADGDQAMALLTTQNDFCLLCIDGVMPGVPTSSIIDRAGQFPSLRVLLCSGYLQEDLLRRGVRAGRYAYLQKPYSPGELLAAVHQVLAQPPATIDTPQPTPTESTDRPTPL